MRAHCIRIANALHPHRYACSFFLNDRPELFKRPPSSRNTFVSLNDANKQSRN